jgi:hypothetical protein
MIPANSVQQTKKEKEIADLEQERTLQQSTTASEVQALYRSQKPAI